MLCVCVIWLVHLQAFAKAKVSNETMGSQAGTSWTPYIQAGKAAGFRINFHGDELNPLGGAEMGASIQAEAISHLEEVRILKLNAWGIWCYSFGNMPSPNSFSDKSSWHSSYGSLWVSFLFYHHRLHHHHLVIVKIFILIEKCQGLWESFFPPLLISFDWKTLQWGEYNWPNDIIIMILIF